MNKMSNIYILRHKSVIASKDRSIRIDHFPLPLPSELEAMYSENTTTHILLINNKGQIELFDFFSLDNDEHIIKFFYGWDDQVFLASNTTTTFHYNRKRYNIKDYCGKFIQDNRGSV